jgi:hypothetical protein
MWKSLVSPLVLLAMEVAGLGVLVFGLTLATGPDRTRLWGLITLQSLVLLLTVAKVGWEIYRRFADPRQPDSPETDYHDTSA